MNRKVWILLWSIGMVSCMHKTDLPGPGPGQNPGPGPVDSNICFERDILPVFISNCAKAGCHDAASAQEGYVFTDYAGIVRKGIRKGDARESKIYRMLTEEDEDERMPQAPAPRLSPALINLIARWINEGAPNTTGCSSGCDSNTFSYSGAVAQITDRYCKGCHSTAAPSAGVTLDTYEGVKSIAASGRLLGAVQHRAGFVPMPQGGSKLTDCEIRQIERWIGAGMPDN